MSSRRQLLYTVGATLTASLSGCTGAMNGGASDDIDADIVAGPQNELRFDPESLRISTGEEITWHFASSSHNVSCNPEHSEKARLPADADPFASYEGDNEYATDEIDSTFSYTFTTPGEYTYVCIPHETNDMTGRIEVQD